MKIKLSKKQWFGLGKSAGWVKVSKPTKTAAVTVGRPQLAAVDRDTAVMAIMETVGTAEAPVLNQVLEILDLKMHVVG